jgi:3-hexulose-6-phosphate synthase
VKQVKFQFAMDGAGSGRTIEDAICMLTDIERYLDIIEVGTSFVLRYGMDAVQRIKAAFPNKKILADMKIMDGGYHNAGMGCRLGGDIITVLGVSDSLTIQNATIAAHESGKEVMVDLLCVKDQPAVIDFCEMNNVDFICVHTGVDIQTSGVTPYADLMTTLSVVKTCKVAVAGGITDKTVEDICKLGPDVVIVGSFIHKNPNFRQAAEDIRRRINQAILMS